MAAASVLSYRLPFNPYRIDLEMILDTQDTLNGGGRNSFIPGQVCRYVGPLTSLTLVDEENQGDEA